MKLMLFHLFVTYIIPVNYFLPNPEVICMKNLEHIHNKHNFIFKLTVILSYITFNFKT